MGVHLVKLLSQRGVETVVTSRKQKPDSHNVKFIPGDAQNLTFLRPILQQQWDAIVDFMVYSTPSFVARAGELLSATPQYVFISTARVYAESMGSITEDCGRLLDQCADKTFLATDEYALRKARQEDALKAGGRSNWTIVRPYITYDANRLQLGVLEKEEWLYRALRGRTIVFSEEVLNKLTTLTHGLDVAKGIAALVGNPAAVGQIYHITSAESARWRDILEIYLAAIKRHTGTKPKVILQGLDKFLHSKPARYPMKYDRLYDRRFDCTKISEWVDVREFVGPATGLSMSIETFMQDPKFNTIDWKHEAIRDRQSGEWTPFKEIPGLLDKLKYLAFRLV